MSVSLEKKKRYTKPRSAGFRTYYYCIAVAVSIIKYLSTAYVCMVLLVPGSVRP